MKEEERNARIVEKGAEKVEGLGDRGVGWVRRVTTGDCIQSKVMQMVVGNGEGRISG